MLSTASLFWLGLSASLISATPIREPVTEASLKKLVNRDVIGEMVDALPSCDDDPSFATVQSGYTDGEGVYIATSCDNNEALWKWKCWYAAYITYLLFSPTNLSQDRCLPRRMAIRVHGVG